ncbi:type II toxin-antitoxin system HicB family antitoxin [Chromobacterium aquaticum]|uniref:Type II toxin-antitoxin system HicB family antitoxin n=1 Tax=Chromobacterium aquaticum TaxID=467180 RepID=A0ABV8ZVJ5_9NEIS|nr:type II toxin-antitoxin system HicB family antitoxin [Chromobacterium aquaticum]MCD5363100.1 type II toxin-antitoxin system HicB family antitoxin [Chromobacterium aquaticum]
MLFPIAIHKDEDSVYGVTVPDVPGCHSWGETILEAIENSKEAILGHIETMLELGDELELSQTSIEELQANPDYVGAIWAFVDVDLSKTNTKPERFNVSWPSFVLSQVDRYVQRHHDTRSGFLARAALELINKEKQPPPA